MQALKKVVKWVLMFFGALMVLGIVIASCSSDKTTNTSSSNKQAVAEETNTAAAKQPNAETPQAKAEIKNAETNTTVELTGPQSNAVRSAEQYISFSGFSRDGLINQLSSSYGDNYDKKDATVAVDSLNIDWNEQAARSAKQYLSMSGFSCDGLIKQLSSSAGDKYTRSQATYGAKQAGACS